MCVLYHTFFPGEINNILQALPFASRHPEVRVGVSLSGVVRIWMAASYHNRALSTGKKP